MQRDVSLKLISLVRKHPCLYDHTLPEYSRKEVTDDIWNEIARKLHLPVAECMSKWRNIRCAYIRSMKYAANETKSPKPYYLHEHLQFVVPFLKPKSISILESQDDNSQIDLTSQLDVKPESPRSSVSSVEASEDESAPQKGTDTPIDNIVELGRKRKAMSDYLEAKMNTGRDEDATRHFMLGLLPELNAMNDTQRREFKIKVILLIDEILSR